MTTPMMRQYEAAKAACGDALLLFRMGDFYELFFEDAETAARALGLTLTSRDKGANPIPMAGFPHHQLDGYLAKIIAAGMRAAICDQVEDPKKATGLVKREVTRVVTPGTVTDDALLDPRASNFLAAVAPGVAGRRTARSGEDSVGLAWIELSTGQFQAAVVPRRALPDELARIGPAECLLAESQGELNGEVLAAAGGENGEAMMVSRRPDWAFAAAAAEEALKKHFGAATLEGFGFGDGDAPAVSAAGAILEYLGETQKTALSHVRRVSPYRAGQSLEIDQATRRSLEITRTLRDGRREGSLLAVIDRTVNSMGARLLADWLANPLTDVAAIELRLDAVEELAGDDSLLGAVRDKLKDVYDVQRLVARVVTGTASPRDLSCLGRTLEKLPPLKAKLAGRGSRMLSRLEAELDLCPELCRRLESALADDCPLSPRDGGVIRQGFDPELDRLRELAKGGKQWIANYQQREIEQSGIPSLKVGYNKVFGYYLEVTNAHRDKVPSSYIRKQTLKNAERYVTPELKEYEEKVLSADERSQELEYELFVSLREEAAAEAGRLQATAGVLAQLDVLAALASLARARRYCRPKLVEAPVLAIVDGRHPVLDLTESEGTFVPNDTQAGGEEAGILLITGPNMAGKSTYIRQTALITLLAQMGSFVPAQSAVIGVADRIFARVGASDELSRGQSTFMVEMTETARILNTATKHSLVILDEIGRGTSTYDGVSLAWSVVEHLHEHVGCRTLFATHYHELTDLARTLPGVKNLNVAVREWQEEVVFLHKIVPGAADKSYGIHVARLAGVPNEVVGRAKEILWRLEEEHLDDHGRVKLAANGPSDHPLLDEIRGLDLDATTPLEALKLLMNWQRELGGTKS